MGQALRVGSVVWALAACNEPADQLCAGPPVDASPPAAASCDPDCGAYQGAPVCAGTCGEPLEFEWFVQLSAAPCTREPVVAAEVPGLVVLAGGQPVGPWGTQSSITGLSPGGCVQWVDVEEEEEDPNTLPDSLVLGVGGAPQIGYYAVGRFMSPQDPSRREQVWIRRYSPTGEILWTRRERTDTAQVASAVVVDDDGGAIVVGGGPTGGSSRGWLRRYAPDGELRAQELWLGDGPTSHILDVARARDGRVWLSFWVSDSFYTIPWLAGLGRDGQIDWLHHAPEHTRSSSARLALLLDDSPIFLEHGPFAPLRVSRWSAAGESQWSREFGGFPGLKVQRAATTPEGLIVAAGAHSQGSRSTPMAVVFASDGAVRGIQRIPGVERGSASDVSRAPDGSLYFTGLSEEYDPDNALSPARCTAWAARARLL